MRALTLVKDDRGLAAVAAAAFLLAASVHLHLLCSIVCLHGEGAAMSDICSSRGPAARSFAAIVLQELPFGR